MLVALYLCLCISNDKWRIGVAIMSTTILFGMVGAAAFLFSVLVAVYELLNKTPKGYWVLSSCVLAVLCGICSVYFAALGEYRFALLPDAYYHTALEPKAVIDYLWISLPVVLMLAFWLKRKTKPVGKKWLIAGGLMLLLLLLCCVGGESLSMEIRNRSK